MPRSRRPKVIIRRRFSAGSGSASALNTNMIDITPQIELGSTVDPQVGQLLVTGVATSTIKNAIQRITVWTGRTSTQPADADRGVRTRDVPANPDGLPFVLRFTGLKLSGGEVLKLVSFAEAEEDASSVHRQIVTTKWAFHELN